MQHIERTLSFRVDENIQKKKKKKKTLKKKKKKKKKKNIKKKNKENKNSWHFFTCTIKMAWPILINEVSFLSLEKSS